MPDRAGRLRNHNEHLLASGSVLLLLLTIVSTQSSAHCWPIGQNPGAGATLDSSPSEVRIRFNQPILRAVSRIYLDHFGGERVSTPEPGSPESAADGEVGERAEQRADELALPLPELDPGRYRIYWTAVTLDGHTSQGDYAFELR